MSPGSGCLDKGQPDLKKVTQFLGPRQPGQRSDPGSLETVISLCHTTVIVVASGMPSRQACQGGGGSDDSLISDKSAGYAARHAWSRI